MDRRAVFENDASVLNLEITLVLQFSASSDSYFQIYIFRFNYSADFLRGFMHLGLCSCEAGTFCSVLAADEPPLFASQQSADYE